MNSTDLTCASFFAGVGGIDLGFEEQGFRTIYANEFDEKARGTFALNFPHVELDRRDIREVSANEVPSTDIIVGGFPCQAFSIEGYQQGFRDEKGRGTLFFELTRIIEEKQPQAIFL
jgi:DNA (cytosine-5)-methyltransferase 1